MNLSQLTWGESFWGAELVPSGNPVLRLAAIQLPVMGVITFPAITATLDGKTVTSPLAFPEEGYYELVLNASPNTVIQPVVIVDTATLKVKIDAVVFDYEDQTYLDMVGRLSASYQKGPRALPRFTTENYLVHVLTNKAVIVSLKSLDGTFTHDMGDVVALSAGRHVSAYTLLPIGRLKVQGVVTLQESPYSIVQQFINTFTPITATSPILVPASPVGSNPAGSVVPASNDQVFDYNGYTPTGVAGYSTNFQAVNATTFSSSPSKFLTMTGTQELASFNLGALADVTDAISSLTLTLTVKNFGTTQSAYVTPVIKDAATDDVSFGRDWQLAPNNTWYDVNFTWPLNPFTGQVWSPGDLSSQRYRFGLRRALSGDVVKCQRIFAVANH